MSLDFRSWLHHESEYYHWVGTIALEIRKAGWMGLTPDSLRAWMVEKGFSPERIREVDALEHFYALFKSRVLGQIRAA